MPSTLYAGFTQYRVTRLFIGGILKGLTHTDLTTVKFEVGFICNRPCAGSPYRIIAVEKIEGSNDRPVS